MKKIKIVFQGDSITDAGRDRRNYHDMGNGYPKYAVELIKKAYPDVDFEFINQGCGGHRTGNVFDRIYRDTIEFQPDIVSILLGINDIWHRYLGERIATTDEQLELNYRCILERIKKETNAKIIILSPYLLTCNDKDNIREDLKTALPIIRKLADEYADVFIPLDKLFEEAEKTAEPMFFSGDGVHPNENGAKFIGGIYADAIKPLIESI